MRVVLAAIALALTTTGVVAFDPSEFLAYHDSFDGDLPPFEGGARHDKGDIWIQSAEDGAYHYINRSSGSAVRFVDLPSVPFAFGRFDTEGAIPAARVSATSAPDGGIGLLVGHPHSSNYALFAIGSNHRYAVLSKASGKLRLVVDEQNDAINDEGDNHIEVERDGANFSFVVNGTEVTTLSDETLADAPIGVGVFGRGEFRFEDLWVKPSPTTMRQVLADEDRCDLPPATPEAKLVLGGIYESAAISSVTIAGQDEVTGTIEVHVDPGEEPLYLVLSSYSPMIYRFTGAIGRIEHVGLVARAAGEVPLAGAVGLPEDRVSFHLDRDCERFSSVKDADRAKLRVGLGARHVVDRLFAAYDPAELSLPDGDVVAAGEIPPLGIDPAWPEALVAEALHFTPSGIVDLSAAHILTPAMPEDYGVLPLEFGLAQLVAEGALEPSGHDRFRVLRTFKRYPASLSGAHLVTFVFPDGIDVPAGNPGHSEIEHEAPKTKTPVSDETGVSKWSE